jgi:membrane associated rhomboid family serine protease
MSNIVNFKKPKKKSDLQKPAKQPFINLPIATKCLLVTMIVIHAAIAFFADNTDIAYIYLNYGFIPAIWTGNSPYGFDIQALISPISYIFLHGSLMHIVMNGAMLMAFGAGVEQWMGAKKYLIFFFLCGIAAVMVETLIYPYSGNPVVGASGAQSGLFAAILILLQSEGRLPTGKYGIWPFAVFWIGLSVLFGFLGGAMMGGQIAWAAHLGGFIAGFALLKVKYFTSPR